MANFLIHVPVRRVLEIADALKRLGNAAVYDFKLIMLRAAEFDAYEIGKVIRAVEPNLPYLIIEVTNVTHGGDEPKLDRAIAIWDDHVSKSPPLSP